MIPLQDRKWCVYKHTSPSNKVYIGITSLKPTKRWANGLGYRTQLVMWNAIKKYGWDNFKHEILEYDLSYSEALSKEIFYIEKYKSNCRKYYKPTMGYNMDDGGYTGSHGAMSEQTKYKLSHSDYNESKRRSIDCYDLKGNFIMTYPDLPSIERDYPTIARTNVVKNCKGIIKSIQNLRFFYNEVTHGKSNIEPYFEKLKYNTVVSQYSLDGKYINTFNTILEAAKSIGVDSIKVKDVCEKKRKSLKGYQWVYGNKEENGEYLICEVEEGKINIIKDKKYVSITDLTGERFDYLVVLRRAENEDFCYIRHTNKKNIERNGVYWLCRCDCGNLVTISSQNLKSRHTISCGCSRFKDLSNTYIGNLYIIEKYDFTEDRENIWRCKCDCGNETFKPTKYFSRGVNEYMCEECSDKLRSQRIRETKRNNYVERDLVGLVVGKLEVITKAENYVSPKGKIIRQWYCKCECGNFVNVSEYNLIDKKVNSCGCLRRNLNDKVRVKENLTDREFGRWRVLYQGEDVIKSNGRKEATWVCKCSCEKETIKTVRQSALKSGSSKSCGCLNNELASERMKKYNSSR